MTNVIYYTCVWKKLTNKKIIIKLLKLFVQILKIFQSSTCELYVLEPNKLCAIFLKEWPSKLA